MKKEKTKNRSGKRKIIKWVIIVLCALIIAAVIYGANYMVDFAVKRSFKIPNIMPEISITDEAMDNILDTWDEQDKQTKEWIEKVGSNEVNITSQDGLKLSAEMICPGPESHKWVITVHGYRGVHSDVYPLALYYGQEGYNVLMPDLRACGESEGDYLGMGWLDRKDLPLWINYIVERDSKAEIVLHGISMGGAAVVMTAGEKLPENVKAVVADCAYTSVWDIFSDELKLLFGLPDFPALNIVSLFCSMRAGYGFKEASALEQVKKAEVPILFIHGSEDNFVLPEYSVQLYEACPSDKDLLIVEGAWHGTSCNHAPELYFSKVFDFLEKYISVSKI